MSDIESQAISAAKYHIESVIRVLRTNDVAYAGVLQDLLDGMVDWYSTKENLFKIGELCHAKALGDACIKSHTYREWSDEIASLRDDCARAFDELEQTAPIIPPIPD